MRVAEGEAQVEGAVGQVSSLLARERQLLHERRELQGQLDRFRLQLARKSGCVPHAHTYLYVYVYMYVCIMQRSKQQGAPGHFLCISPKWPTKQYQAGHTKTHQWPVKFIQA